MADLIYNYSSCSNVTITTPTTNKEFLKYINGTIIKNSVNIRKYTIDYGINCCSSTKIDLPVRYQFTNSNLNCQAVGSQRRYTLSLLGINSLFVKTFRISYNNVNFVTSIFNGISNGISYDLFYNTIDVSIPSATAGNPQNTQVYTHYLELTTIDDFIYKIKVSFTLTQPGLCNISNVNIVSVIYPSLPDNVYIFPNSVVLPLIANSLSLNQLIYGIDTSIPIVTPNDRLLKSGVYQVIICELYLTNPLLLTSQASSCVQNSLWLDCGIKCDLINKLINCKDSDIFNYFDALNYSNECETSYEDKCAMYELMINKLNSPGCYDPYDDCNCNDSTDSFFKNRNTTNNGKVNAKPCGCGS